MSAEPTENFWWAGFHNTVVHPLMWLLRYPKWVCQLHDWTGEKAWPKGHHFEVQSDPNPGKLRGDLRFHGRRDGR